MANMSEHGETTTAEVHETSHEGGAFPPFDPANFAPLIIWLALTFGVLYLLMSRIALPRVKDILHERQEKIRHDLNEAHAMREKAQAAAAQHDKTINDAKAKAQALAQETAARLHAESETKRQALEADLNTKLVAAEASILEMKTKAMTHVSEIAQETAAAIVQHLTGKAADPKAIAKAIASTKA
jgi:F-type H+-transporting ATPase subunit b